MALSYAQIQRLSVRVVSEHICLYKSRIQPLLNTGTILIICKDQGKVTVI